MKLIVVDASALVGVLADSGGTGSSVAEAFAGNELAAPELLPFEAANVLRRLEQAGQLAADTAALAHADMLDLPVQLWPYSALATRAWSLRGRLSMFDAAYVALAAQLDVHLVTLDRRLAREASACCDVLVPGGD